MDNLALNRVKCTISSVKWNGGKVAKSYHVCVISQRKQRDGMGCSKRKDVRIHVEKMLTYSEGSILGAECVENISTLVLSLTGSFFICRSSAEKIGVFERVLSFRNIHFPSLKSSTAPGAGSKTKVGMLISTFARICLLYKLSENTTCFFTASSPT